MKAFSYSSEFIEKEGVYHCPSLSEFAWLTHAFGSRHINPVAEVTLRQIHSDRIWNAETLSDRQEEGDGLINNAIARTIGVRTADCVPILLVDPHLKAVAAVHAGWRGTAAGIAGRAIQRLSEDYGSQPADLYAAIGPSIRGCCYEVSPDVAQAFTAWPESVQHFADSKPHIDLASANSMQLVEAGLQPQRIADSHLCTACLLDRFFSFRREPQNPGRMLSVIGLI